MPIRICTIESLTPVTRGGHKSAVESLPEWQELRTKLSAGLRPFEAVEVELPSSPVKSLRELLKSRAKAYLKKLSLTDYEVKTYKGNGKMYVSISNTAAV